MNVRGGGFWMMVAVWLAVGFVTVACDEESSGGGGAPDGSDVPSDADDSTPDGADPAGDGGGAGLAYACGDVPGLPAGNGLAGCDDADSDCPFAPDDIDCAAACANWATICNDCGGEAAANCVEFSEVNCVSVCGTSKALCLTNWIYGCLEASDECDAYGTCAGSYTN